jgi:hypothetical protein
MIEKQNVFERFGGIRPMASKLGLSWGTVSGWHQKLSIPSWRHEAILSAAIRHNIPLSIADLTDIPPNAEPFKRGAPERIAA